MRYLTQVSMIGKERERGSRRDVHVVHTDAWHEAIMRRDHLLGQPASAMASGVEAVGGIATPPGRRLQLSIELVALVTTSMAAMSGEWEQRKAQILARWPPAETHEGRGSVTPSAVVGVPCVEDRVSSGDG